MNGLRLRITWNEERTSFGDAITATVMLPDKEIRGMAFRDLNRDSSAANFNWTMLKLIKNLSDEGWATRIINDNEIEVIRLNLPADIKHERCKE
jgi:hypothetical protein